MLKNFFKSLYRVKLSFITFILIFFLLGFFITEFAYNNLNARYLYCFNANEEPSYILDEKFYDETFQKIDLHNKQIEEGTIPGKKISYAKIDYHSMLKDSSLTQNGTLYTLSLPKKYFKDLGRTSNGTVNFAENRVKSYFNLVLSYGDVETSFVEAKLIGNVNPYMVSGYTALGAFGLVLAIHTILFLKSDVKYDLDISDNDQIFRTPFHKKYWSFASKYLSKIKNITIISILFALMIIAKMISLPSGFGALGLGLGYLFFSVIGLLFGPLAGLAIGFLSDTLGYFLFQSGTIYFPGYTLDAMLAGLTYGLFFYRTKITFTKCLWARFIVNFIINVGLGSLWWKIIYGLDFEGYLVYVLTISLPKNIIYLLPQSIVLFLVFKALLKPLNRFNLVDYRISDNVTLF